MPVVIQTIPSTVIHTSIAGMGKPLAETLGAIPAGIVLGWLALRTGSFLYPFILHASIGFFTDFWQYLRHLAVQ